MKKVIVTGGAGFIGSHTCVELVNAGYLPVVVDHFGASERSIPERVRQIIGRDFPVYDLDCRDEAALSKVFDEQGAIFGVIHFAAHKAVGVSVENPLEYYANNVGSLVTLLRLILKKGVNNFVFSSSCTVYGQPDTLPVTEASPQKTAESPYGRTKQVCEAVIEDVVRSKALLKAVTLRYFNPVGAHPSALIGELPIGKPENLVPFITQTAVGLRDQLTVFGSDYPTEDGTCVRDYIHVVDLARAHVLSLDWLAKQPTAPALEVFNLGSGKGTSVLQAISAFEQATGQKLNYRIGPRRPGDVIETYASVDKAARELGFNTQLTMLEAMRDAYKWQIALRDKPLT
jgi:UDP-glucose 4-epimerase